MRELVQMLEGYLMGANSLGECAEWLAGVDWNDPAMTEEQRGALGTFELLITEVAEGLREEREFREEASRFMAARTHASAASLQGNDARRSMMTTNDVAPTDPSLQFQEDEPGVSALMELYERIESVYVKASRASAEVPYATTSNSTSRG